MTTKPTQASNHLFNQDYENFMEAQELKTLTGTTPEEIGKVAVKFDAGKLDWSLMPWEAVEEVVKVLAFGAKKYNEAGQGPQTWNWTKGPGLGKWRTLSAIFRHLTSYAKGQTYDEETGLNHLAHAACGILFLLHYHKNQEKYTEFKD